MQAQVTKPSDYIPEFDAFRAFGVIMVMLTHTWPEDHNSSIWKGLQLSWVLMDGFFVISGFLIARILLETRSKPGFFRTFYTRRALRLLPLYYAVVVILTVVGTFSRTAGYRELLQNWGSPLWFWAYIGNIPTAITGTFPFGLGESFVPLWSLQVEEQFYLLFPLLIYYLRPNTLKRVLWGLAGLSVVTRIVIFLVYPDNLYAQYVLLPCRMDGLAFGALIAIRLREGPWEIGGARSSWLTFSWMTVTLFCGAIAGMRCETPFNRTLGYLLSSIAAARMVLWFIANRDRSLTRPLRWGPVQYIGKISYGAYLLHEPIQWLVSSAFRHLGFKVFDQGLLIVPVVIGLTLIAASLSWRYIESPLMSLKGRSIRRREDLQLRAA